MGRQRIQNLTLGFLLILAEIYVVELFLVVMSVMSDVTQVAVLHVLVLLRYPVHVGSQSRQFVVACNTSNLLRIYALFLVLSCFPAENIAVVRNATTALVLRALTHSIKHAFVDLSHVTFLVVKMHRNTTPVEGSATNP